tara:strand:- start:489 stop:629 length:141 start_codon:yes stop_codon:yes gene_type:complete
MNERLYDIYSDLFDWLQDARTGINGKALDDVQEAIDLLSDAMQEIS